MKLAFASAVVLCLMTFSCVESAGSGGSKIYVLVGSEASSKGGTAHTKDANLQQVEGKGTAWSQSGGTSVRDPKTGKPVVASSGSDLDTTVDSKQGFAQTLTAGEARASGPNAAVKGETSGWAEGQRVSVAGDRYENAGAIYSAKPAAAGLSQFNVDTGSSGNPTVDFDSGHSASTNYRKGQRAGAGIEVNSSGKAKTWIREWAGADGKDKNGKGAVEVDAEVDTVGNR